MRARSRRGQLVSAMGIFSSLLALFGCVTIQPQPLPPQRTKAELRRVFPGSPDRIVTAKEKPLPHGADELWVFEIHAGEERYYFKGDTLIAVDLAVYETL